MTTESKTYKYECAGDLDLFRTFKVIGAILAGTISWEQNHSIFWGAIHAFFHWFYIVYLYFMES